VTTFNRHRGTTEPRPGRGPWRRAVRGLLAMTVAVLILLVGAPVLHSQAMAGGRPADSTAGSVRIFLDGKFQGCGTLVDRNWAVTAGHLVEDVDAGALTVRFGVVNGNDDGRDTTNARTIDRVVTHPEGADVALVHFADPVPPGTWIAPLASRAPPRYSAARLYGWGPDGHTLNRAIGLILEPIAQQNADYHRGQSSQFRAAYPGDLQPMAVNVSAEPGDSGGGLFTIDGTLIGIHNGLGDFRYQFNASGKPVGSGGDAAYEQPVWVHQQWIQKVISGEGTSGESTGASTGGQDRRRLDDEPASGRLPMSLPPQVAVCDVGAPTCTRSMPSWAQGVLLGAGNYRGTAQARCAAVTGNDCSFNGVPSAAGASARMALGPASAPSALGTRDVMVWCRTSTPFPEPTSPTREVVLVSFTNGDPQESPLGYGWWDLTLDQVGTGNGQTLLDTGNLTAC
jgi:Trypsin